MLIGLHWRVTFNFVESIVGSDDDDVREIISDKGGNRITVQGKVFNDYAHSKICYRRNLPTDPSHINTIVESEKTKL